jgi:hypothetical protein
MKLQVNAIVGIMAAAATGGCGLLPTDTTGDERYRQDFDACSSRGATEYERTQELLGPGRGSIDSRDPLAPGNIAESRGHRELSDCMRSKGWRDLQSKPAAPRSD